MKQLNILVANQTLSILAGSETWTLTLAMELKRLGNEITAYSPNIGFIATKMEAAGIKCVKELAGSAGGGAKPFDPYFSSEEGEFDVIICSHYEITKYLHSKFPNTPIIAMCHGIIHKNPETGEIFPEHPITEFKVDQYLAPSEEVQELLKTVYNIDAKIMRQFFDLERFKKVGKLPKKPKTILVNSNYWGAQDEINQIIKEVANHYDAKFIGVGANFAPTYETDEIIKDVDIVFGMGRSVLEGVCMGKTGVVHGRWGTGGVITPESVKTLRKTNFSGRPEQGKGELSPAMKIIQEIDAAWNQKTVDEMRICVEKEHNVKVAAKEFIKIAEGLIGK